MLARKPIMPHSWQDIEDAFDQAAALQGNARRAFLDGLAQPELRAEVESLLAAGTGADELIENLIGSAASTLNSPAETLKQAGPWCIERQIGEGGMGAVYLAARQGEGFRQTAALKLLRPGFGTRFFVSRFRQERRILATLDHPNIAHLLDGGTAADGRPYIALEYVDGETITSHCREQPRERRIQLFLDVCRAVEHAHQRMVIHRDLKPSNIMVNREGQVKLLDFGIAKILDPDATGSASLALTGTDVKLMTPDYAAPEQVRGETITTATDVYCLGLVLFELLTGKRPFELPTNAPLEAARIVCTSEPAKTGLPADLDAILRKCLRKEPAARYSSVSGLREDLERALRGEAVIAYQGAWTYRAGKWIRRYKWAVAAAALVATTLAGGIIATARQAAIAQRRYEDVRRLARTVIFDVYDQVELIAGATKARETIANTALQYLEGLTGDAKSDPGLAMELAEAYLKVGDVLGSPRSAHLGRFDDARKSFDKAAALYEQAARDPRRAGVNRGRAQVLVRLASLAINRGDYTTAIPLTVTAEELELAETNDEAKRDWPLLIRVAFEREMARAKLQGGGWECKKDAEHFNSLASRWHQIHADSNSGYWTLLAASRMAQAEANSGEPSAAIALMKDQVRNTQRELASGNSHAWLRHDLGNGFAHLVDMHSGIKFPSLGDAPVAVRLVLTRGASPSESLSRDGSDAREKAYALMRRCAWLPALSQTDAAKGWEEYLAVSNAMREVESVAQPGSFDSFDYGALAVGGVRAAKALGQHKQASQIALQTLGKWFSPAGGAASAYAAHVDNILRSELALLGGGQTDAAGIAASYHRQWPFALLLHADLVKLLALNGETSQASTVLAEMPPCEYRRRIERELKNLKFFD